MSDKVIITRADYDELLLFKSEYSGKYSALKKEIADLKKGNTLHIMINSFNGSIDNDISIEINTQWTDAEIVAKFAKNIAALDLYCKELKKRTLEAEVKTQALENIQNSLNILKRQGAL